MVFFFLVAAGYLPAKEIKESDVPSSVRSALKTRYPGVYVYEWEWKKKELVYKAEFMKEGNPYDAYFRPDGKWIRTRIEIPVRSLPPAIQNSIAASDYRDWTIDDVKAFSTPERDMLYVIELEQGKKEVLVHILPEGQIIGIEKK